MERLMIRGGYGEHGRSCFLMPYDGEHYFMVDCGIMDTDENPYPEVDRKILEKVSFLFLTHCHKDHSGAFSRFVQNGFRGVLIASKATIRLAGIQYLKIFLIDADERRKFSMDKYLKFSWGRSGHCSGSVWYILKTNEKRMFFSGDYQSDTLAYECDAVHELTADLGVIDCAHAGLEDTAQVCYEKLTGTISKLTQAGQRLVFPLPQYGRGLEILALLRQSFPKLQIAAEEGFMKYFRELLEYEEWIRPEVLPILRNTVLINDTKMIKNGNYHVLLIGDTHLKQKKNMDLVQTAVSQDAKVIITGRIQWVAIMKHCLRVSLHSGSLFHTIRAGAISNRCSVRTISPLYFPSTIMKKRSCSRRCSKKEVDIRKESSYSNT